jgi:hypothetical protein
MCAWQTSAIVDYQACGTKERQDGPLCNIKTENFVRLSAESGTLALNSTLSPDDEPGLDSKVFCLRSSIYLLTPRTDAYFKVLAQSSNSAVQQLVMIKNSFHADEWTPLFVSLSTNTRMIHIETNLNALYIARIETFSHKCYMFQKCTFEDDLNCSLFLIKPPAYKVQAENARFSMPIVDVTLRTGKGHYLYVKWPPSCPVYNRTEQPNDLVQFPVIQHRMSTIRLLLKGYFIVDFYVYQHSALSDVLHVIMVDNYLNKKVIWNSDFSNDNAIGTWSRVMLLNRCPNRCRIEFEWTKSTGESKKSIAIVVDDIQIRDVPKGEVFTCRFEHDFCTFVSDSANHFSWMIGNGRVRRPTRIPAIDASLLYPGQFAYVDFTDLPSNVEGVQLVLFGVRFDAAGWQNLTIEFLCMTSFDSRFDFILEIIDSNERTQQLMRLDQTSSNDWQRQSIMLFTTLSFYVRIRIVLDRIGSQVPFAAIRLLQLDRPLSSKKEDTEADGNFFIIKQSRRIKKIDCSFTSSICDWQDTLNFLVSSKSEKLPIGLNPFDSTGCKYPNYLFFCKLFQKFLIFNFFYLETMLSAGFSFWLHVFGRIE